MAHKLQYIKYKNLRGFKNLWGCTNLKTQSVNSILEAWANSIQTSKNSSQGKNMFNL